MKPAASGSLAVARQHVTAHHASATTNSSYVHSKLKLDVVYLVVFCGEKSVKADITLIFCSIKTG